jgi:hypothetical protein
MATIVVKVFPWTILKQQNGIVKPLSRDMRMHREAM